MITTNSPIFEHHCGAALDNIRVSLTELYQSVGADPESPQETSRRYELNRNLTWKVSRIMRAEAPQEIFQHLPGVPGLHILIDAFLTAGAPVERTDAVRAAIEEFESMVALHAGDRQTLELMLDSLSPGGASYEPLEASRKLAFRGNSGIWGMQTRAYVRTAFLAPSPEDPGLLDTAQVVGVLGLRRLRHGPAWPLYHSRSYNDDGSSQHAKEQPLEPDTEHASSFLMPRFSSHPVPEIRVRPTQYGRTYEQVKGQLGNCGMINCTYGSSTRRFVSRYRDERNTRGEFLMAINAPVENLVFDVIVHRDLVEDSLTLESQVIATTGGGPLRDRPQLTLLGPERIRSLGVGTPRLATPLVPRYSEIAEHTYRQMGWDPADFLGWRFEMKYPPLPCTVVLSYGLPAQP